MTITKSDCIRELNDIFRKTWLTGKVLVKSGLRSLGEPTQSRIAEAVERFTAFTVDNDPHGEHDPGSVTIDGYKVFWKIDYCDLKMEYGSEDPANPLVTKRVLTILALRRL